MNYHPIKVCGSIESKEISGKVHSVFKRVANIETYDGLVPIIIKNLPMQPHGVKININEDLRDIFTQGDDFRITLNDSAEIWDPEPVFSCAGFPRAAETISLLERTMRKHAKFDGIAALAFILFGIDMDENVLTTAIKGKVSRFLELAKTGSSSQIEGALIELIGFGIGLTPSADDFITGFIISAIYKSANERDRGKSERVSEISDLAAKTAAKRTTTVSAEMIRHAAAGRVSENIRSMMTGIFDNSLTEKDIVSVLENGETSGSDMVAGVIAALRTY